MKHLLPQLRFSRAPLGVSSITQPFAFSSSRMASDRLKSFALLDERQAARKAKDFKRSDAIRDELKAKGWVIEDTPKGARLKRS